MPPKNKKYVCIHGHFYQPPRENPWLEFIETQNSALPIHDWNERVFLECYAPNAAARICDLQGNILKIVNNYEYISFNFGPTLFSWLAQAHEDIYQKIIEADQKSSARFKGHGNAMSQVYNHIIMPLATYDDKVSQIIWGIKDFEMRFCRKPEGMWLAETAVDTETLTILQEQGIKFTVLSPYQASSIKKSQDAAWTDVNGGKIDTRIPYKYNLPNGNSIALFFYNGHISKAIAFNGMLDNSDNYVSGIMSGFYDQTPNQLVHVATDGESYGHHKKFAEMTLAFAIYKLESSSDIELTNYGAFLAKFPPTAKVKIIENSAWSCAHGVERWRSNCGCSTSALPCWNQEWRTPLRDVLNKLNDVVTDVYQSKMSAFASKPQKIFQEYFDVVCKPALLDKKIEFAEKCTNKPLRQADLVTFYKLLEMKRNTMLMFTSCGWFFADISGIETIQILLYAQRAIQFLKDFNIDIEHDFIKILKAAVSNVKEIGNGQAIYTKFIKSQTISLKNVGIHFALNSIFEDYADINKIYAYEVELLDFLKEPKGGNTLAIGHILIESERTGEKQQFCFAVIHFGSTDFHCTLDEFIDTKTYEAKKNNILDTYRKETLTEIIKKISLEYGNEYYTSHNIFTEEKRNILNIVTKEEIDKLNQLIFHFTQKNRTTIEYCFKENLPIPTLLIKFNEYTYQKIIEHLFSNNVPATTLLRQISQITNLAQVLNFKLTLDEQTKIIEKNLELRTENYFKQAESFSLLEDFLLTLKATSSLPVGISFWNIENKWYDFFINQESLLLAKPIINNSKIPALLEEIKSLLKIKVN